MTSGPVLAPPPPPATPLPPLPPLPTVTTLLLSPPAPPFPVELLDVVVVLVDVDVAELVSSLHAATKKLSDAWAAASQDLYKAGQSQPGGPEAGGPTGDAGPGPGGPQGGQTGDDVTDVEFEEGDKNKK